MATKYESYETGDVGNASISGDTQRGQTFTPQIEHILGEVKIYCHQVGTAVGIATVEVYACTGGHLPTGEVLATGTFDPTEVSDTNEWVSIPLTGFPTLSVDTEYCIIVKNADSPDGSNCINWRINTSTDGYARGTRIYSLNGGVAWSTGSYDALFQEWSNGPPPLAAGGGPAALVTAGII